MRALSDLLQKRTAKNKIVFSDKDVFYIFTRIIKKEFGNIGAGKFQADFFKNKTVFVRCESPIWGSELFLNKDKIIREMNKELGEGSVKWIKTK